MEAGISSRRKVFASYPRLAPDPALLLRRLARSLGQAFHFPGLLEVDAVMAGVAALGFEQ
jgi:hypothetical protein